MNISILLQNLVKNIEENFKKSKNFEEIVNNIRNCTDDFALNVIKEHIEAIDCEIVNSAERKKEWYIQRNNDPKTILTEMGTVTFKRTYFKKKNRSEYEYLVDRLLDVDNHQKLDKGYQDKLIEEATNQSYEKTSSTIGKAKISRQSVKRLIHKYDPADIKEVRLPKKEKRKVEYLYIDADEDHISVKDKKYHNQNILYVYEGKDKEQRNSLINAYYITGINGKKLFEEAWEYIRNNYDTKYIKRIYIQGDGAHWIKNGTNILPNSRFVLDKFHLWKYIKECTRFNEKMKKRLYEALCSANKEELDVIMNDILDSKEVKAETVFNHFKYFFNNLEAIEIYENPKEKPIGCSAEGHVSHILSARMSSRPLTWCVRGANNMSKLRVYLKNQGKIKALRESSEYVKSLEKKYTFVNSVENVGKIMYDEYDNIEILRKGHRTPTFKMLRELRGNC